MDWVTNVETNLWGFPRGLEREGAETSLFTTMRSFSLKPMHKLQFTGFILTHVD